MRTRALNAYLLLAGIFLGALVVCNLIVGKFFSFEWPLIGGTAILSVGILPYPLTFLVTDLLSEVYGRKRANVVVWIGLVVSLLALLFLAIGAAMPAIDNSRVDDATYHVVFGSAPRAIFASMVAYLFAQWFDIQVFHFWKRLTKGKWLWFRNNASTVLSQFLDTALVVTLLFAGEWPTSQILAAIGSGWLFKALCALADTPLIYLGVWLFKRFDLAPEDSEYYRPRRAHVLNHEDLEEREAHLLGRLAVRAKDSRGRRVPEAPDPLRTCFQRDRDRILHSRAFRRLQRKTQVFPAATGDHYRTRLTHTLEVSQLARSACLALRLNSDLAEAVALAHDLGHPPFGHVGERALHARMREHGGFRHNAQGLRIVDELEESYAGRPGLNLCQETRACLRKGEIPEGFPLPPDLPATQAPYLEGQLVDLCDRVAYVSHDMEDAIRSGLVAWEEFAAIALPREAFEAVLRRYPALESEGTPGRSRVLRGQTVSATISMLLRDMVEATDGALTTARRLEGPEDVRGVGDHLATHTPPMREQLAELLRVLGDRFYRHPEVLRATGEAADRMSRLFERLVARPEALPARFFRRIEKHGLERTVCDYVSGMTDSYVDEVLRLLA